MKTWVAAFTLLGTGEKPIVTSQPLLGGGEEGEGCRALVGMERPWSADPSCLMAETVLLGARNGEVP